MSHALRLEKCACDIPEAGGSAIRRNDYVVAYIDDIAVYSETWEEHLGHIKEVLRRVKEAGLTLRPDKCRIGDETCELLGFHVGGGRISPVAAKVMAVKEFIQPKTKKRHASILRIDGLLPSIPTKLCNSDNGTDGCLAGYKPDVVEWTPELDKEFLDLKAALTNQTFVKAPHFDRLLLYIL